MDNNLVACVTGSGGGIGREVVKVLNEQGMTVVGIDTNFDCTGTSNVGMKADVSELSECLSALQEIEHRYSRLDIVVAAAGVNLRQSFDSFDVKVARRLFDINVWGTVNILRAACPLLFKSPSASVVIITSISGELGFKNASIYGMSKMALDGLVHGLAVEWAAYPVRVNAVAPAIVETEMNADMRKVEGYLENKLKGIPLGRTILAQEVAEAAAFLAGPRSSAITGEILHVDGGSMILGK